MQQRVRARSAGVARQLDGIRAVVRAGACDDRDAVRHLFHRVLHNLAVLAVVQRRRLPRRTADDDGVDAAGDLVFQNGAVGFVIDLIVAERRDDRRRRTAENRFFFHKN